MDSQKIPLSPALQRLGEEFQAVHGERLEARGGAKILLKFLAARNIPTDEQTRSRILDCVDVVVLEGWAERAAHATSLEQVFAG